MCPLLVKTEISSLEPGGGLIPSMWLKLRSKRWRISRRRWPQFHNSPRRVPKKGKRTSTTEEDSSRRPLATDYHDPATSLEAEIDPAPSSSSSSLQAAMEVSITAWLGPVGPLIRKLRTTGPYQLQPDEIRLLEDLCMSLKNLAEDEDTSFTAQSWMKIVRELCYDVEDHLDEVIHGGTSNLGFPELLARVKDASERRHRFFNWSPPRTVRLPADDDQLMIKSPGLPILDVDAGGSSMVGVVEPAQTLVELLALDDQKTLKVIAICGCPGVGKTTTARTLYEKHAGKFQCRAFVSVSRNPDMRSFLTTMLSQLKAPRPHGFPDTPDLIDAIRKHLQCKRYFIIIDDLWTASVWDIIRRAFPHSDQCSRIITTTHIDDVALACCSYDPYNIYKMDPVDDYASRELLFGRVSGSEDSCRTDIKEISNEIIKKCGGLPLAVINVASLLASKPNIVREKWKHIQEYLSSSSDGMKDVLNLIYSCLPPRLRTCLLYLSMYPDGYVIKKDELVKHWVAEGFPSAVEGRDTGEIAEGYFDELVSRGMIQAVETKYTGEVLSCTVHQMVLDFIRYKSMEENFVITVNYFQSTLALPDKVRRLSIQFGGVKSAYIPENIITSQVRSLIFWGFFKCIPSILDCGLLRVLSLHIWADQDKTCFDLTRIGELFRLKYLKIECNITVKLPSKIQSLQNLGTLHIYATLFSVPSDIITLERLLHLRLPSESILPHGVSHMKSLRTLGCFDLSSYSEENVMQLGRLTNLQDLQLTCSTVQPAEKLEKNVLLLGSILAKLRVLQSVTLVPASGSYYVHHDGARAASLNIPSDGFSMESPPPDLLLRRIELSRRCCIFFSLPKWFQQLSKLCILKIAVRGLSREDMDILKGLPALTALTLYIQTAPAERIIINKGGFQVLTYFKFMCTAQCLAFVHGVMPKVKKLKLGFNSDKMNQDSLKAACVHHLTGLTEISVKFGTRGADEFDMKAAESALEAAVSNHPNPLIIRVQRVDVIFDGEEYTSTMTEGKKGTRTMEKRHETREGKKKNTKGSEEHVNKQVNSSRCARTDGLSILMKHHAQSVDLVMGAMGNLLPKLLELFQDKYNLRADIRKDIESLYKELEGMQDALHGMKEVQRRVQLDVESKLWAKEARDLSYDVEDIVDSFLVRLGVSEPGSKHGGILPRVAYFLGTAGMSYLLRRGKTRGYEFHDESNAMNGIIKMVQHVVTKGERYKVVDRIVANPSFTYVDVPHMSCVVNQDLTEMVGTEVSMGEVIRMLRMKYDTTQLDVVSIFGMGGLGKTILAKAMYDWAEGQFDCRAFVSVSQHPDMKQVFMDILIQIDKEKYMNIIAATLNENLLIEELRGLLADKRYFIVIDDIWNLQPWEIIKSALLIDNKYGGTVITTTRILEVAAKAGEVYMLKPLSPMHSRELFNTLLFGDKGKCPIGLSDISEKLVRKCGGFPLAITTVAKLLAGKSSDEWSKVSPYLGRGYEDNEDLVNMRNILLSSYYDLPCYLRTCLLYLHIFPRDHSIKKEILIWKWVAEGFIPEKPGTGLFELGEVYFNQLIDRSLIMPIKNRRHGIIVGCHVHYMVFDFICSLSMEEDFVAVLDIEQHISSKYNARRLAIQNRDAELYEHLDNTPIRQVRSFNATFCHFSMTPSFSRFKVLRVLAIEECTFAEGRPYHLEQIGMLIHLRYLGLYNTHIYELPAEIGHLRFLQTLDLRGTGVELPHSVCQLSQLKCLRTDGGSTRLKDWIEELTSLEELQLQLDDVSNSVNFVKELGKLTELRELQIGIERFHENSIKALVESMGNLQKLQVLALVSREPGEETSWEGSVLPLPLRDLSMKIASSRLPAWINSTLVPNLSHLSVDVKSVKEQDLENLGRLQGLISLELLTLLDTFPSVSGHGAFPRLRYFGTSTPVRFLQGAMPCLESFGFEVHELTRDVDFYFSTLEYLPLLQKVEVEISSAGGLGEAVHEALKRAVEEHPNSPKLAVVKTDQVDIAC
uniref:Uncharacterized protein n=2 Tax=Avena sativa TaxID=4498 RepID=A0ACD5VLI1_AVESA